jgi:hypothetical protein
MVLNPLKIQDSKKLFLGIYPGTKFPFLGPKKFLRIFGLQLVPSTTFHKKLKHMQYLVLNTGSSGMQAF